MKSYQLYQRRKDGSLSHITTLTANDTQDAIEQSQNYWTTGEKVLKPDFGLFLTTKTKLISHEQDR